MDHRGVNRVQLCDTTKHSVAVTSQSWAGGGGGRGSISQCLSSFGSCSLVTVVYLTMTMRWRKTSHDIEANHTICVLWSCYNVVRLIWDRTTSHDRHTIFVRHHTSRMTIAPLSHIRKFYLLNTQSWWSRMSSCDYRSTGVRCRTIYLWFSFPPSNHSQVVCHRTTIVRLYYDVIRFHRHYRCVVNPSFRMTTKLRLWYRSRRRSSVWPMLYQIRTLRYKNVNTSSTMYKYIYTICYKL